jgi:hypothetical protein
LLYMACSWRSLRMHKYAESVPEKRIYPEIGVVAGVFDSGWCRIYGLDQPGNTGISPSERLGAKAAGSESDGESGVAWRCPFGL